MTVENSQRVAPLTDEETKRLRALLLADTRRQWLVSSIAGASRWIAAVVGAWLLVKGFLVEAAPWLQK